MWLFSIFIGLFLVALSLFLLKKEIGHILEDFSNYARQYSDPVQVKDRIDELNASFYQIADDLEGKYSIHERQIADLEAKVMRLETLLSKKGVSPIPASKQEEKEERKVSRTLPAWKREALERVKSGEDINKVAGEFGIGKVELELLYKNCDLQ